jgi:hypothetical protein
MIINIDELKRKVNVFIRYCDYIREDCEEDLEEELYEFVIDLVEDYEMEVSALRKKLSEM